MNYLILCIGYTLLGDWSVNSYDGKECMILDPFLCSIMEMSYLDSNGPMFNVLLRCWWQLFLILKHRHLN